MDPQYAAGEVGVSPAEGAAQGIFDGVRQKSQAVTIGAAQMPALSVIRANAEPSVATLPVQRLPLIGRDHDIEVIGGLIEQAHFPIITLTGPGGIGKTQLAIAVAHRLADRFPGGCWFVDLSLVQDAADVPSAMLHALGIREANGASAHDRLRSHFDYQPSLLVLDNFEQVIAAGMEIANLLVACPLLTIVVTSRVPLHLSVEQRYPVSPMATPDSAVLPTPATLQTISSVQLFVRSARAVDPAFGLTSGNAAAVAEICIRLDGVPLAIELAAARSGSLSPASLLTRLDRALPLLSDGPMDAPPRLRTMHDAIGWSYDLLDAREQEAFRRLAVFAGGFTVEAAHTVAFPEDYPPDDALASLISLSEKNLLTVKTAPDGDLRFGMLATVREFGLELLDRQSETSRTRDRHAAWVFEVVQRLFILWGNERPRAWRAMLMPEHDNLRAALIWLAESGNRGEIVRLAGRLAPFWRASGQWEENATWLRRALTWSEGQETHDRLEVLVHAGNQWVWRGDEAEGTALLHEALALAERIGQDVPLWALSGLGLAAQIRHDFDECAVWYERAIVACEAPDRADPQAAAEMRCYLLSALGWAEFDRGDIDRAVSLATTALEQIRVIGLEEGEDASVLLLGVIAATQGNADEANRLFQDALELARKHRHLEYLAAIFTRFAEVDRDAGNLDRAAMLLGATARLCSLLGGYPRDRIVTIERVTGEIRARLGESAYNERWQAGRQRSLDDAIAMAREVKVLLPSTGVPPNLARRGITSREFDVLCLLAEGKTDQEIADALYLSRRTINTHVSHLLAKLQVSNRREASALARNEGLLTR